ncbi:MAG: hypothetical protein QF362_01330, partial [Candidatus Woesearchaeota archaeon]|nr:hypothetical protein [Candidatus Woesearchaeota archaeon]
MVWPFTKNHTNRKLRNLHIQLIRSFSKIKQDMAHTNQWIHFLYKQNLNMEDSLNNLSQKFDDAAQNSDTGKIMQLYSSFNEIQSKVSSLKSQVENIPHSNNSIISKIDALMVRMDSISSRVDYIETKKPVPQKSTSKNNLQKVILKDLDKKSKDYISNFIFSLIKKYEKISASQLKRIV